jgi:hypothetical protein
LPTNFKNRICKLLNQEEIKKIYISKFTQHFNTPCDRQNKEENNTYQNLFSFFGFFFLAISLLIFSTSPNFLCNFYFRNGWFIKHSINLSSFLLSTLAFYVSYNLKKYDQQMTKKFNKKFSLTTDKRLYRIELKNWNFDKKVPWI